MKTMSKGVYLLQTCDLHKSHSSARAIGFFTEDNSSTKKVLHKITKEWKTFFDSKENLNTFIENVKRNGLAKELNSDTNIYAMCTWVEEIT